MEPSEKEGVWRAVAVLSFAGVARLFAAAATLTIAVDGVVYIKQARLLASGQIREALAIPYHIGYAAVVAALHRLLFLPNTPEFWELAGQVVSLFAGFVLVVILWRLGEEVFGQKAGFWVGLAAVNVQLVRFSAQVRSEALYLALLFGAVLFGVRFLKRKHLSHATLCGLMVVLAYLVRPEALLLVVVLFCFLLVVFVRGAVAKKEGFWRDGAGAAALCGVVAACALPYMLAIAPFGGVGKEVGTPKITLKRDPFWLLERRVIERDYVVTGEGIRQRYVFEAEKVSDFALEYAGNLGEGAHLLASRVLHPVIAVVVVLGVFLFLRRGNGVAGETFRRGAWFLLLCGVGYFLLVSLFGVTHRHLTQPATFLLLFCGVGVLWLGERLKGRPGLAWALLVIAAVLLAGRLVVARHSGYLAEREAGLWLRRCVPPYHRIACRLPRLLYYSDLQLAGEIQLPRGKGYRLNRRALEWVLKKGCELVAVDAAPLPEEDKNFLFSHKRLVFMARFRRGPQDILIFSVRPAPPTKRR